MHEKVKKVMFERFIVKLIAIERTSYVTYKLYDLINYIYGMYRTLSSLLVPHPVR